MGARTFSKVTKSFSHDKISPKLKKKLDKRAINHAFSDGFNVVNFAFILPPLLTHGKVRKAGSHIEKAIYHGKLSFTMVKKGSNLIMSF